jgi:predicted nucleic acid-binding protein
MSKVLLDTDVLIDLLRGREATRTLLREAPP